MTEGLKNIDSITKQFRNAISTTIAQRITKEEFQRQYPEFYQSNREGFEKGNLIALESQIFDFHHTVINLETYETLVINRA